MHLMDVVKFVNMGILLTILNVYETIMKLQIAVLLTILMDLARNAVEDSSILILFAIAIKSMDALRNQQTHVLHVDLDLPFRMAFASSIYQIARNTRLLANASAAEMALPL
jgi:hypothetical protein